jgi:methylenetetrahydrofolate dehydrogenase (NADP+)/methenyltetrahydrofolate cyclohydrolase
MNTKIFEGKTVSLVVEEKLKPKVEALKAKGITPKLVSILVGDNRGSELYLSLKKKAAKRLGLTMELMRLPESATSNDIVTKINKLNSDNSVNGIMVQLPLPKRYSVAERTKIVETIVDLKDVDGMKLDSPYVAPVVMAVISAIKEAGIKRGNVAVIGSKGFVGQKMIDVLKGFKVTGMDMGSEPGLDTLEKMDVIISASGVGCLVSRDNIKEGAVCIDVGAPRAEFEPTVLGKAGFLTPVPGGIGPLTI